MRPRTATYCLIACLFVLQSVHAQNYPDQYFVTRIDSLVANSEANDGLTLSGDGKCLMLQADRTDGSLILKPQYAPYPFNMGLPSWNGSAPGDHSAFKVQMRFPSGSGWSPWLTVGFWKANIWSSYGATSFAGGTIDIDNAVLSPYVSSWQFKIIMTRTAVDQPSPTLRKLSFVVSDSRTTSAVNITQLLNDKPAAVFIPTDFIYQYGVDPTIGGDICSPTSVSMILRSFQITVDPRQFALDTRDPVFDMFGVWPRVVQNAAEYGLDGVVTRYRSWSQARQVLADGGRIAMSVGPPLYSGHLMMLAGFTAAGDPIVHDPARSNGYSYVFNKSDLSHSWFDKGGVAYTFSLAGNGVTSVALTPSRGEVAQEFALQQNYPNPFNPSTKIRYTVSGAGSGVSGPGSGGGATNSEIRYQNSEIRIPGSSWVRLSVYDVLGREVAVLVNEQQLPGTYEVTFDGSRLASGVYFTRMVSGSFVQSSRMVLSK